MVSGNKNDAAKTKIDLLGYNLLEITIVLSLISILSLIAIPHYQNVKIRHQQKSYLSELAFGHIIWLELEQLGRTVDNIDELANNWPFYKNRPDGVQLEMDVISKTISIIDQRDNNWSTRCHKFSLNRYGLLEINDVNSKSMTTICSVID